jgi:hypothetical protein
MSDGKKRKAQPQLDSRNMQRKSSSNRHQSRDKNQGSSGGQGVSMNSTQQVFRQKQNKEEESSQVDGSSTRYTNRNSKRERLQNMVISSNFEA